MEPTPRQSRIIDLARRRGRVGVDALAGDFGVTPQTIRRDLNELCQRGVLSRVHGGAVLAHSVSNFGYQARRVLAADGKRWIGERAAALIPDDCSLFINIGTTTEQVARALQGHKDLLVISNNINVINILNDSPGIEVIVAGGLVRKSDGGILGEAAVEFIRQFKVDYAVIGTSAIDSDGALLDYDFREVKVAQAILENARHSILVADAMKWERTAPMRITELGAMDAFVTDQPPPLHLRRICREGDVQLEFPPEA